MREVGSRGPGGKIAILGFNDPWGEREYLYTFTDLCDRAGCHCLGNQVVCTNWGILFMPDFYHWYHDVCMESCECFEEDSDTMSETSSQASNASSTTWSSVSSNKRDWAAENARKMRQVYSPIATTKNGRSIENSAPPASRTPPSRLTGKKPCLAGQAAGWTFDNFAKGHCCPGYSFQELSASEAYVNYGLPIGNIVAGIWTIGMCLKTVSG